MIRVLLVDDHALVRTGIRRILEAAGDLQVVGEAESGERALESIPDLVPEVVLLDISMPGVGGLETTRRIGQRHPEVSVIALSVHAEQPFPRQALEAGARGYLTKSCAEEEFLSAVRCVHAGERYISGEVARQMALSGLSGGAEDSPFERLSRRELQVVLMLVQGHSVYAISEHLHLSPKTVSTYRYRVFDKLAAQNDVELTRLAVQYGLL